MRFLEGVLFISIFPGDSVPVPVNVTSLHYLTQVFMHSTLLVLNWIYITGHILAEYMYCIRQKANLFLCWIKMSAKLINANNSGSCICCILFILHTPLSTILNICIIYIYIYEYIVHIAMYCI